MKTGSAKLSSFMTSRRRFLLLAGGGAAALVAPRFVFSAPNGSSTPEEIGNESHRPQFHFTYKEGWLSDINGLFYYKDEYHLFTQHCPNSADNDYRNTHWGHAISKNLVTWEELPPAIAPDAIGPAFSGSSVVDWANTSGFQTGEEIPVVAFYTGAGYVLGDDKDGVVCIAYSNDRGRTWTKYKLNPVLEAITHCNRDPKVFWHQPSRKWVMALSLSCGLMYEGDYEFAFFTSSDLKSWTETSRFTMPRGIDCPDVFELSVEGTNESRWVFWAGDGTYAIGRFDGRAFTAEHIELPFVDWFEDGANGYAAQIFNDIPGDDGRTIQLSWFRHGKYPGMPFNQQATIPVSLTLRHTLGGIRLCRYPVKEVGDLHGKLLLENKMATLSKANFLSSITGELFDIHAEIMPGKYGAVVFEIRDTKIVYDPLRKILSCNGKSIPAASTDGSFRLRLLIDRTSLEIFADNGSSSLSFFLPPDSMINPLKLYASGEPAIVKSLAVWEMRSMYEKAVSN